MQTEAIYLIDPYDKEIDAKILEVQPESKNRWRVMLDHTVFYPMGGGQPTDQGAMTWADGQAKVYQVMLKDGEIWHYLETAQPPAIGDSVHGAIDWERRFHNMRVHTGGHLVDFALFLLGYVPDALQPLKGDHGKKPFVMYAGSVEAMEAARLEEQTNALIQQNKELRWEFTDLDSLKQDAIYLQPNLPINKPLRKLTMVGVGSVADGGTILANAGAVGALKIVNIETQDGTTKISYQVTD